MYYGNYGYDNYGMQGYGYGYGTQMTGYYGSGNKSYALILVLFILLVIIGCTCRF
jgi:uncharacterized protein (TIGR01732 family)